MRGGANPRGAATAVASSYRIFRFTDGARNVWGEAGHAKYQKTSARSPLTSIESERDKFALKSTGREVVCESALTGRRHLCRRKAGVPRGRDRRRGSLVVPRSHLARRGAGTRAQLPQCDNKGNVIDAASEGDERRQRLEWMLGHRIHGRTACIEIL